LSSRSFYASAVIHYLHSFHRMTPRPPSPTLFPYTTLFRSLAAGAGVGVAGLCGGGGAGHAGAGLDHAGGADLWALARHGLRAGGDRKSTRLNSSHVKISYAVFCLKKKIGRYIRTAKIMML